MDTAFDTPRRTQTAYDDPRYMDAAPDTRRRTETRRRQVDTPADTIDNRRRDRKTAIAFATFAAFCVLLARVYALYSHGVDSVYMTYAFCYPLIGGVAVYLMLMALPRLSPSHFSYVAFNAGVVTLTLGSILAGVFEIAGTASRYQIVYTVAGTLLAATGIIGMVVAFLRRRNLPGRA